MKIISRDPGPPDPGSSDPQRIRRAVDVEADEREPLLALLRALDAAKPAGLPLDEWEVLIATVPVRVLERAIELYVPIAGRMTITGRGFGILSSVQRKRERATIWVELHAIERAQSRRVVHEQDKHLVREEIVREVQDALWARRKAQEKPRWLELYGTRPAKRLPMGDRWFLWNEACDRAWVAVKDAHGRWTVLTTLRRPGIAAAAVQ